ncbi:MAG: acyclic terpene utilization AtuA family protein [Oscillospiraceae bacterium]|nr:acyclic terpene utilization AtuA family protein [Oscillospiraceae bacterium]
MKIVALNGLLGYGYSEEALNLAFSEKVDYLGVDAGSTDPGPYYLGSGKSFTDRGAVKRDLTLALPKALEHKAPFIIGTAGGAGSELHVRWLKDILLEIATEEKLSFKLGTVLSDVRTEYVLEKLDGGKMIDMSSEFPADRSAIKDSVRIVSQVGIAPIIELLKKGADVIICGRACDTAIYAAPCIYEGFNEGLSFHMAKIMECGAMCSEPVAAADVMQGYIYDEYFELRPANPVRRCTVDRVAAHTLYEQSNPYLIYEPDGVCDLTNSRFEQVDERTVRVSGSVFREAEEKTLKLEGVKCSGFRTICPATIYDSETVKNIDLIIKTVTDFVKENTQNTLPKDSYTINFKLSGGVDSSLGIIMDIVGKTQEIADTVCALARSRMLHCDYDGRKSTAGNLAFPFSPSDIHVGEVYEFSVFHLVKVDSLLETAQITTEVVGK